MRKTLFIFCSVLSLFLFAVSASAVSDGASIPDANLTDLDGLKALGIFDVASCSDAQLDFVKEWLSSDRNLLGWTGSFFYMVLVPDNVNAKLYPGMLPIASWTCDKAVYIPAMVWSVQGEMLVSSSPDRVGRVELRPSWGISIGDICSGTYLDVIGVSISEFRRPANLPELFKLRDNAGLFNPPPIPLPPPLDPDPLPEPEPLPPAPPIDSSLVALQQPYVDAGFRLINVNMGKIINAAFIVMLFVAFLILAFRIISEIGGSA